jgi:UTP:GlnB (protein PII) uridylyltransferase
VNTECGVARLEAAADVKFGQIAGARERTEDRLAERRERIASVDVDPDATVVLMGSWGRREVTSESDDDFMVLLEGAPREDPQPEIDRVAPVPSTTSARRRALRRLGRG